MRRNFGEETALQIMNTKLRGKPREAVYKLTDAELAVLRDNLANWTVGMSQILAERVGDMAEAEVIIRDMINLPSAERMKLAESAGAILERGEIPPDYEFAAYILSNHSDQVHIEDEIARRENLN